MLPRCIIRWHVCNYSEKLKGKEVVFICIILNILFDCHLRGGGGCLSGRFGSLNKNNETSVIETQVPMHTFFLRW